MDRWVRRLKPSSSPAPAFLVKGFLGAWGAAVKTEESNMNNSSSERLTSLVQELDDPVMGAFLVKSIGHSETLIRKAARARRRTYSSCTSAARNGLAKSAILQALNSSIKEGKYAAAAVNITDSADRLAHEATQQQIRSSLAMAA